MAPRPDHLVAAACLLAAALNESCRKTSRPAAVDAPAPPGAPTPPAAPGEALPPRVADAAPPPDAPGAPALRPTTDDRVVYADSQVDRELARLVHPKVVFDAPPAGHSHVRLQEFYAVTGALVELGAGAPKALAGATLLLSCTDDWGGDEPEDLPEITCDPELTVVKRTAGGWQVVARDVGGDDIRYSWQPVANNGASLSVSRLEVLPEAGAAVIAVERTIIEGHSTFVDVEVYALRGQTVDMVLRRNGFAGKKLTVGKARHEGLLDLVVTDGDGAGETLVFDGRSY